MLIPGGGGRAKGRAKGSSAITLGAAVNGGPDFLMFAPSEGGSCFSTNVRPRGEPPAKGQGFFDRPPLGKSLIRTGCWPRCLRVGKGGEGTEGGSFKGLKDGAGDLLRA